MNYQQVFERFVPPASVSYCVKLWEYFGFEFKIKKSRQTKLGDYRYVPQETRHVISINNDLNPFSFLVTYLHEVAHLVTFQEHGRKAAPHGKEWKQNFKRVVRPVLNESVFPLPVLAALNNYFKNPKASSCSDPELYNILKKFDGPNDKVSLKEIQLGASFNFNGKTYQKIEKKRTRSVCLELRTNRRYLIAEVAEVKPVSHKI